MKKISLLLVAAFCSFSLYSQQITYKDLIGTWDMTDTSAGKMTYQFIDSTNILLSFHYFTDVSQKATYKTEIKNNINRLLIINEVNGIKQINYYLLKLINADTFKLQIDYEIRLPQWDEEKGNNTATYLRRKGK